MFFKQLDRQIWTRYVTDPAKASRSLDFTAQSDCAGPNPRVFVCDQHRHTAFLVFLIA
jgi:hypothetical protein